MPHRESIKEFLKQIKLEDVSVVDWGRGTKPVLNYTQTGENVTYFGIDKLKHVDAHLVADMQEPIQLEFQYDIAFCMEVLEHVQQPDELLGNIWANLKDGGTLYMSVPFLYPVHHTEDYWRFTDQGIKLLLERNRFAVELVEPTEAHAGWLVKAIKK